ncbi:MAG: cation-translocating P-type ATPase [Candidatus Thermoplasmatota archaeon]
MDEDVDDCPYCQRRVDDLSDHLELEHEELTLKSFIFDSKIIILTGLFLLLAFISSLIELQITVLGLHISRILLGIGILIGGAPLAKASLKELISEHTFDVDGLVVVASIGAVAIGYWWEAAVLIFLFSIAERLEDYSVFRSRRSLKGLLELSPTKARVVRNDETTKASLEEISIGETVVVKPGERVPLDGEIKSGSSSLDESAITGESVPKEKGPGDGVFAGTLNTDGLIEVKVTKESRDSTLSKIVRLVEEAEKKKADTEKFVNRFANYYTPVILLLALGVSTIPWLFFDQPFTFWLYRGLILLVLSCPCAFVVSTPVSMVSSMTQSAKKGVLIKGSIFIEKIREIDTVVFDKTGTLTTGDFSVTEIVSLSKLDTEKIALISSSLESSSEHPLALPIIEHSDSINGEDNYEVEEFRSLTGVGIEGIINGEKYRIGNPDIFELEGEAEKEISRMTSKGETVVVLGREEKPLGLIGLEDTLREEAREVISSLKDYGIEPIMLTGDNERTASTVAEKLGIDRYIASVLPDQKLDEIEKLQEDGLVTMIGDGVNDAPALVKSDVGIAMGAAGSDTAMESADMALMEDDLSKLTYLFDISERTMKVVKENIVASIGVKLALAVLTFFGFVTLWIAVGVGDVGMALLVTLNALLLGKR